MPRLRSACAASIVLVLASAHCSAAPEPAVVPSAAAACTQYYAALAAWSERCAQGAPTTFRAPANVIDACAALAVAPGSGTTPQRLAECAAATERATCQTRDTDVAACLARAGSLADGSACGIDAQCKNAACIVESGKACGICKGPALKDDKCGPNTAKCGQNLACLGGFCVAAQSNAGERCVAFGEGPQCAAGLACLPTNFPIGVCGKAPVLGQPCESRCAGDASCENGSCVAALASGSACQPVPRCTGGACTGGSICAQPNVCDELTKRCQPVVVQRAGGACDFSGTPCQEGTDCAEYDGTKPGECRPLPGLGLACTTGGPACQAGLRCVDGKCAAPAPATCQ